MLWMEQPPIIDKKHTLLNTDYCFHVFSYYFCLFNFDITSVPISNVSPLPHDLTLPFAVDCRPAHLLFNLFLFFARNQPDILIKFSIKIFVYPLFKI